MLPFHVSFICHFLISMYSQRLSRVIHQPIFSPLDGAQFTNCFTCLATKHFVLVWADTAFSPVHSLLFWVLTCLNIFLFHDLFAISPSQCATIGSAELSTHTILVTRLAHYLPIALPALPPAILFRFEHTIAFQSVHLFHIYTHFLVFILPGQCSICWLHDLPRRHILFWFAQTIAILAFYLCFLSLNMSAYISFPCFISFHPSVLP